MSPRTKEEVEKIRQEKKGIILDTALKLFSIEGYHGTSVAKIAKEAGISKGLMYNYFESKELVIKELIMGFLEELLSLVDMECEEFGKKEFLDMIEKNFQWIKDRHEVMKLYFSLTLQPSVLAIMEDKLMEMAMPIFIKISGFFESLGFEDPYAETRYFNSMMDGIFMNYVIEPDTFPLDKMKEKVLMQYETIL